MGILIKIPEIRHDDVRILICNLSLRNMVVLLTFNTEQETLHVYSLLLD